MKEDASFNAEMFLEKEFDELYLFALFRAKDESVVDRLFLVLYAELKDSTDKLSKMEIEEQKAFAFQCIDQLLK